MWRKHRVRAEARKQIREALENLTDPLFLYHAENRD